MKYSRILNIYIDQKLLFKIKKKKLTCTKQFKNKV